MNLADAIRQAAQSTGTSPIALTGEVVAAPPVAAPIATPKVASAPVVEPTPTPMPEVKITTTGTGAKDVPGPTMEIQPTLNTVRLEIVLSPEQLSSLFRAIVAGQHSVMTLREAAAFLRLPSSVVDQMATDGKIPAFSIDGKWRFSHSALEEWMSVRQSDDAPLNKAVGA